MARPAHTVLVVDDDPIDREVYRRYLHQATDLDCTLLEADLGEVGITLCQQAQPDVVLLDYRLPDLDGLEFLKRIQTRMDASTPPIILITGCGSEEIAAQAIKSGAEDYLVKQRLTPMSLQESVRQVLASPQLRQQLIQSEARFQRAIAEAPFPIFIHSEDGKILQMSQAVLEITGYTANEIQTISDWTERVYGECEAPVLEGINRLYDLDRRVDEGEFEIKIKDGSMRTWFFSSAPLGRLNNQARLVISIAADITERKQTEAVLSARLKQQAALAQLSQTALSGLPLEVLWDQAAELTATSLEIQYCEVLGISTDGRSLMVLSNVGWSPDITGQVHINADLTSQAGYTWMTQQPIVCENWQTETRFQASSMLDKLGVMSSMSVIIPGQDEHPFGVLAVHSVDQRHFTQDDVNFLQAVANLLATAINRKQIEQELQQLNQTLEQRVQHRTQALEEANRELEAFSYSVAHDLRAPLRSIQGFAQVLQEDYETVLDELGTEYIHRMGASAEHLDTLIRDLLTYSRIGRTKIHLQPVNVAAIVQDILADLDPLSAALSASVEVISPLTLVMAYPSMLQQVLGNLISNALKFVAPDVPPQIKIWTEVRDCPINQGTNSSQRVRIWVADNGIGILPQHQQRIFSPFERLHGVDAYSGTGIGLSIVARGIQRMGGEFGVESALHQGSQFWIELAAAAMEGSGRVGE